MVKTRWPLSNVVVTFSNMRDHSIQNRNRDLPSEIRTVFCIQAPTESKKHCKWEVFTLTTFNGLYTRTLLLSEYLTLEYQIHLNTGQYGCLAFKWLSHVTCRTIQILDILDHEQAFFILFSDHHLNSRPFDNETQIYNLNT